MSKHKLNQDNKKCKRVLTSNKILGEGAQGKVVSLGGNKVVYKMINKNSFTKSEYYLGKLAGDNNIGPKVYDFFSCDNKVVVVMERITETLEDWLKKPRTHNKLVSVYKTIMRLIGKMHKLGLIHGDLKIDNIGRIGNRWVVIDYGWAFNQSYKDRRTMYYKITRGLMKYILGKPSLFNERINIYLKKQLSIM